MKISEEQLNLKAKDILNEYEKLEAEIIFLNRNFQKIKKDLTKIIDSAKMKLSKIIITERENLYPEEPLFKYLKLKTDICHHSLVELYLDRRYLFRFDSCGIKTVKDYIIHSNSQIYKIRGVGKKAIIVTNQTIIHHFKEFHGEGK